MAGAVSKEQAESSVVRGSREPKAQGRELCKGHSGRRLGAGTGCDRGGRKGMDRGERKGADRGDHDHEGTGGGDGGSWSPSSIFRERSLKKEISLFFLK